jgi:hypothetical protein
VIGLFDFITVHSTNDRVVKIMRAFWLELIQYRINYSASIDKPIPLIGLTHELRQ